MPSPVWSTNEYDPLEAVVVGSVEGAIYPDYGPVAAAVGDPAWLTAYRGAYVEEDLIDAATEQLDGLVDLLRAEGITVERPDPMPHNAAFASPWFQCRGGWNAANPRDLFLVVGDRVIECATPQRYRHFESLAYRRLVERWSRAGARCFSAPRPSLREPLYDWSFVAEPRVGAHGAAPLNDDAPRRYATTEVEAVWEAADFTRCDDVVFAQRSHVTNRAGIDWVRRMIADVAQVIELPTRCPAPHHIDTTFVPLRPRTALVHPQWFGAMPDALDGWTLIEAPAPQYAEGSPMASPLFTSQWLSMNVLSLDHDRVIVDASQTELMARLSAQGFTPVPLPFDAVGAFGGSFHCATLDLRRTR